MFGLCQRACAWQCGERLVRFCLSDVHDWENCIGSGSYEDLPQLNPLLLELERVFGNHVKQTPDISLFHNRQIGFVFEIGERRWVIKSCQENTRNLF